MIKAKRTIAIFTLILCIACNPNESQEARSLLKQGRELVAAAENPRNATPNEFQNDKALDQLSEAIGSEELSQGELAEAFWLRGQILVWQSRYMEAIDEFRNALRYDPNSQRVKLRLGIALNVIGNDAEALTFLNDVIDADPNRFELYGIRATVLSNLGRRQEAIQDLTTNIEGDPTAANRLEQRADLYYAEKMFEKAAADYESAINEHGRIANQLAANTNFETWDPILSGLYVKLGNVHRESGQLRLAAQAYGEALAVDSGNKDAEEQLSEINSLIIDAK